MFAAPGSDLGFPVGTLPVSTYHGSDAARADVAAPPEAVDGGAPRLPDADAGPRADGADDFDLVLNNSLHHLPVAMAPSLRIPVVTTLHTPPVPWLESAIEVAGGAGTFVAVSRAMRTAWSPRRVSAVMILNGVDPDRWVPGPGGEDAVWSGRLVAGEGSARGDRRGASHRSGDHRGGADAGPRVLRPRDPAATRRPGVRYAGHLDQRAALRPGGSSAVAVVTPQWDEPYGLVAAEAMACGTPVAAYARGGLTRS